MAPKRIASDAFVGNDDNNDFSPPAKLRRLDGQPDHDALSAVGDAAPRRKAQSSIGGGPSPRTGQACDRCKRRKIKCDATPGGCMPCRQAHYKCQTTDRNTGRATERGHIEELERTVNFHRQHAQALEQQLRELGAEPRLPVSYDGLPTPYASTGYEQARQWTASQVPATYVPDPEELQHQARDANVFAQSAAYKQYSTEIATTPPALASPLPTTINLNGKKLEVLGHTLDIADCLPSGHADPRSKRSLETMHEYCRKGPEGGREDVRVSLTKDGCMENVKYYMTTIHSWIPILHEPQIHDLVNKVFEEGYQPDPAEIVILHMINAYIISQLTLRNHSVEENNYQNRVAESDGHYLYALTFYHDLVKRKSLLDLQALGLLCIHACTFPTPSVARSMLCQSWAILVDTGLHRSTTSWPSEIPFPSPAVSQLRKLVFWSFVLVTVPIYGKLNLPMPIEVKDFDIELPESLNDLFEPAPTGDALENCTLTFRISHMKLFKIYLKIYSITCAANGAEADNIRLAELKLKVEDWRNRDWPEDYKQDHASLDVRKKVIASWLQYTSSEALLMLNHPSKVSLRDPEERQRNTETRINIATDIIDSVVMIWRWKALETCWTSNVAFIEAIFTKISCFDERLESNLLVSSEQFASLRKDLGICMKVCEAIGQMLGSGQVLASKMKIIIDDCLDQLNRKNKDKTDAIAGYNELPSSSNTNHLSDYRVPGRQTLPDRSEYQPATETTFHESQSSHQQMPMPQIAASLVGYQQTAADNRFQYSTYAGGSASYQGNGVYNVQESAGPGAYQMPQHPDMSWPLHYPPAIHDPTNETANTLVSMGQPGNVLPEGQQVTQYLPALAQTQGDVQVGVNESAWPWGNMTSTVRRASQQ